LSFNYQKQGKLKTQLQSKMLIFILFSFGFNFQENIIYFAIFEPEHFKLYLTKMYLELLIKKKKFCTNQIFQMAVASAYIYKMPGRGLQTFSC